MYANPFDKEFNRFYLNDNPTAAWWNYIMGQGFGGNDAPSHYAQNQQSRYYNQFQAEAGQNPTEGFYDWLNRKLPNMQNDYWGQSPSSRGDFTAASYSPRSRWVMG